MSRMTADLHEAVIVIAREAGDPVHTVWCGARQCFKMTAGGYWMPRFRGA